MRKVAEDDLYKRSLQLEPPHTVNHSAISNSALNGGDCRCSSCGCVSRVQSSKAGRLAARHSSTNIGLSSLAKSASEGVTGRRQSHADVANECGREDRSQTFDDHLPRTRDDSLSHSHNRSGDHFQFQFPRFLSMRWRHRHRADRDHKNAPNGAPSPSGGIGSTRSLGSCSIASAHADAVSPLEPQRVRHLKHELHGTQITKASEGPSTTPLHSKDALSPGRSHQRTRCHSDTTLPLPTFFSHTLTAVACGTLAAVAVASAASVDDSLGSSSTTEENNLPFGSSLSRGSGFRLGEFGYRSLRRAKHLFASALRSGHSAASLSNDRSVNAHFNSAFRSELCACACHSHSANAVAQDINLIDDSPMKAETPAMTTMIKQSDGDRSSVAKLAVRSELTAVSSALLKPAQVTPRIYITEYYASLIIILYTVLVLY